tara:strand:- start:1060 stop:1539 length:480 start_codon:yes stop_codon:yes gene_type:complete
MRGADKIKNKIDMKKKVIRLNEQDIEKLVKKIIKEDDTMDSTQPKEKKEEKKTTVTTHAAYAPIDRLETQLEQLKMEFKKDIANAVSGVDGYHSEIDKFSEDFGKFITKVSNLKSKINDYQIETKDTRAKQREARRVAYMSQHNDRKHEASKRGRNYSK